MNRRGILIGGIAASVVIGMWEMVVEAHLQGSANPIPFRLPPDVGCGPRTAPGALRR